MSGFIPKRVLNARIGTTIEKNQTPMEAGLAPRIGKSAASIRLYYQRVDECFCPAPCEPITIVKRIVWYPYNNALDSQGNSRPNGSNYVAIQFNKPLSVFPDPGLTNPTIQGWGHPIPGGWAGGNPALTGTGIAFQPARVISLQTGLVPANTWRLSFSLTQSAGPQSTPPLPSGTDPGTIPGRYFQSVNQTIPVPPSVYLMEDLKEYNTNGILEVKHPGQWVVFWVSQQINGVGPLGQNRIIYKRYLNAAPFAVAAWDDQNGFGGILNVPSIQLLHKLEYAPPLIPQDGDAELRTFDCDTGTVAPLAGFQDSYLNEVFVKE